VLAVVIIALVIDLALQLLGRVLTPWLHATTRRARVEGRAA
jgi:ABC-type proline/glycine betaine transport system permease subunit